MLKYEVKGKNYKGFWEVQVINTEKNFMVEKREFVWKKDMEKWLKRKC
jgi:hypothetical protein